MECVKKLSKLWLAREFIIRRMRLIKIPIRRRRFNKLGGRGVPLIVVGKQSMSGYSAIRLEEMLAKAKGSS